MKRSKIRIPKLPNEAQIRQRLTDAFVQACEPIHADFQAYLNNFGHRPRAKKSITKTNRLVRFETMTSDNIARYVDEGTKPHVITARRSPMLSFRTGYTAKSAPGSSAWNAGGGASGGRVYAQQVRHPGTKARLFTDAIARKHRDRLFVAMSKALSDVLR